MKIFFIIIFIILANISLYSQIDVFSDFEGGNIQIISIDKQNNSIYFRPNIDANNRTRCWFFFGVANAKNKKINFYPVEYDNIKKSAMPVYSYDKINWYTLKTNADRSFSIFSENETLFVATGFPYLYSDLQKFLKQIKDNQFIDIQTLTYSEDNHLVPLIIVRSPDKLPQDYIFITVRQHAFETPSNFVLEGFIKQLLDIDTLQSVLSRFFVLIVPMVDVDNVIKGQSGRMQKPVDFNRDWQPNSQWNAIKEIIKLTDSLEKKQHKLKIYFDFHATYPSVDSPVLYYFNFYGYGKHNKKLKDFWRLFGIISHIYVSEIPFLYKPKIYYADQYFSGLNGRFSYVNFATTIEFPWFLKNNSQQWTKENLKHIGRKLAITLILYSKNW